MRVERGCVQRRLQHVATAASARAVASCSTWPEEEPSSSPGYVTLHTSGLFIFGVARILSSSFAVASHLRRSPFLYRVPHGVTCLRGDLSLTRPLSRLRGVYGAAVSRPGYTPLVGETNSIETSEVTSEEKVVQEPQ